MQLELIWFVIVALMLATYVILDGFDLGVGILHLFLPKNERERQIAIRSIGPVWDGNEVWLLAAGGTLYFAFPGLYATGFSGFYIALMLVLWLLIFRATSIELRNHFAGERWKKFWDRSFGISSLLITILLGAALGNVIRGVPLQESGWFFTPLVTTFCPCSGSAGLVDWYTVIMGLFAVAAFLLHGSTWLSLKSEGEFEKRSSMFALKVWWGVAVLFLVAAVASFAIQPLLLAHLGSRLWLLLFPLGAVVALFLVRGSVQSSRACRAFMYSSLFLLLVLATFVFCLYPTILPSTTAVPSLTVGNTAAPAYGLKVGLFWWVPGMILAVIYFRNTYRTFAGKVRLDDEGY